MKSLAFKLKRAIVQKETAEIHIKKSYGLYSVA